MFTYAHGGHSWVCMDAGEHNRGLGHGKEAKRVADDRCQSFVHARAAKRQMKTRFGEEGQRWSAESNPDTQDMF